MTKINFIAQWRISLTKVLNQHIKLKLKKHFITWNRIDHHASGFPGQFSEVRRLRPVWTIGQTQTHLSWPFENVAELFFDDNFDFTTTNIIRTSYLDTRFCHCFYSFTSIGVSIECMSTTTTISGWFGVYFCKSVKHLPTIENLFQYLVWRELLINDQLNSLFVDK